MLFAGRCSSAVASLTKSSKSLNDKVTQILRGVFNAAVDNNLIAKSPVPTKIKSRGIKTKEKTALTVEQSERLLDAVRGTRAYLFCLIALQTGMRRGEICGLMWDDVDLDKQMIHVTPHLLRHTYITRLFESGLDIKEIQYLAGHTTVDMTLRVYTHYQQETRKNDTAKKVREALG